MKKLRLTLVFFSLMLLIFGFLSSGVTHAATNVPLHGQCYYHPSDANCDGQEADLEGCPPTNPVASANIYEGNTILGVVWLEYSDACESNWSIVEYESCSRNTYEIYASITREDGKFYSGNEYNTCNWGSPMVYAPVETADACGTIWITSTLHYSACTGYYLLN